ncbi:MAG: InlB B-repeat-containing protein, partial [Mediterranea sp.]|nr:InlB B-repeat-containing protein [Mediterranea sp.]
NVHTVSLPKPDDQKKWELGKSYDYELNVSLTAVTFGDVSIKDWGTPILLTLCERTYDANNGTGEKVRKTLFTGRNYSLIGKPDGFTPPAANYLIYRWNTKADGTGTDYRLGADFTQAGDMTLYARWIEPVINVETGTYPADYVTYDGTTFTIVEDLTGYSYVVTGSTGAGAGSNGNRVVVKSGVTATVTLRDATIDLSGKSACAFNVSGAGVTLKLEGTNTLKSGVASTNNAGLLVPSGTTITITSSAGDGSFDGTLNVAGGAGTWDTAGRWGSGGGAGIGGNGGPNDVNGSPCGTVIINGGTIVATGHTGTDGNSYNGYGGAGIGGGGAGARRGERGGAGGTVIINKGHVTATGQSGGAGIGGGGKSGAAANYTGPGDDQDTSGGSWSGWDTATGNTAYVSASGSRAIGAGT